MPIPEQVYSRLPWQARMFMPQASPTPMPRPLLPGSRPTSTPRVLSRGGYASNIAANNAAPLPMPEGPTPQPYQRVPYRSGSGRMTADDIAQAQAALNDPNAGLATAEPLPSPTAAPRVAVPQRRTPVPSIAGSASWANNLQGANAAAYANLPLNVATPAQPQSQATGGFGINPETGRPFTQAEIDAWGAPVDRITVQGRPVASLANLAGRAPARGAAGDGSSWRGRRDGAPFGGAAQRAALYNSSQSAPAWLPFAAPDEATFFNEDTGASRMTVNWATPQQRAAARARGAGAPQAAPVTAAAIAAMRAPYPGI